MTHKREPVLHSAEIGVLVLFSFRSVSLSDDYSSRAGIPQLCLSTGQLIQAKMADIHVLTEQLKFLVESPKTFPGDEAQKRQILQLSREAAASLESPFEMLQKLVYSVRTFANPNFHRYRR